MLQLVASYSTLVQQAVTQVNQYQTMLQNLMDITPSELLGEAAQVLWRDQNMVQAFKSLQTIVVAGQKIDYTLQNADQFFRNLHPGYGSLLDFQHGYRDLSDTTLNAIGNSLAVINAQTSDFANEQSMVQQLQQRSQSATGQLQALKAANDIGVAMIGQFQKLRELMLAQGQSQDHYLSMQTSMNDSGKSGLDQVFGNIHAKRITAYTPPSSPASAPAQASPPSN
ncbi:hypothetical protein [Paraburkholderia humisilvae]|nr:hypothetical protein [Paraburkholderia humisilvae]